MKKLDGIYRKVKKQVKKRRLKDYFYEKKEKK